MKDDSLELGKTVDLELALAATVAPEDTAAGLPQTPAESHGERFTLGREIGRGGMGRVVEATDRQFRRTVAVKEMLPGGGASAKHRFLTEALVTGNLEHPGIPAVYERGDRADGTSYYAMQRVSGRTLAEALDQAASLAERVRLLPAIVKVAETVAYAHDRGVVHRDLKPENVLLGKHGEVFLLDWGIAKVRGLTTSEDGASGVTDGAKTQVGSIMGSPMYMSPEQARGDTEAVDERTDVFALGTLLYHVLTGRPPYDGKTVRELATRAAEARPAAVTELVADVNPELAAICARAMSRDPADRHRSALELAAALEAFQSEAARKPASRLVTGVQNAGLAAVSLIAALLLGVGFLGVYIALQMGGVGSAFALVATVVSLALAMVEWKTGGHARLVGVGLSLALITLCVSAGTLLIGVIHTLNALQAPELLHDTPKFLQLGALGLSEASHGPFASMPLALAQVVLWALVARRSALLAERGRA